MSHRSLRPLTATLLAFALSLGPALASPAPATREGRLAELEALTRSLGELRPTLETLTARLQALAPHYIAAHDRVQAVPLSREERVALKAKGIEALTPAKAAPFREAAAPLAEMDGLLKEFFAAYDTFKWNEARTVVFGALLRSLEVRQVRLAGKLSEKQARQADALLAKVLEKEAALRAALADPEAATYMKASSIDGLWKATHFADEYLEKMQRKHGLLPRRTFGQMLRGLGERIGHFGRVTGVHARTVPALAKVFGYLLNPFRKKGDPEKFSGMLRDYARSYQKASGMEITVEGAEGIPEDGPIVYAAAHRGGLGDMIAMLTQAPTDFSFLAHWGVFPSVVAKRLRKEPTLVLVGVPKEETGGEKIGATQAAVNALKDGRDLLVFAEGSTPSKNGETNGLRTGIDYMTEPLSDDPIYIVPVGIKGPADGFDSFEKVRPSLEAETKVRIAFGRPIDPLKLKAIPGSGQGFLLNLVRAFFNMQLDHADTVLRPAAP